LADWGKSIAWTSSFVSTLDKPELWRDATVESIGYNGRLPSIGSQRFSQSGKLEKEVAMGGPPGHQTDPFSQNVPSRTPGPLGHNDAGDPDTFADAGSTPRPIGTDDRLTRDHHHGSRESLTVADDLEDPSVAGWPSDLMWSQFDEIPRRPPGVKEDAQTATNATAGDSITIEHDRKGFRLGQFTVTLTFDSGHSWLLTGKNSVDLLRHEQVHWDIAGLNAHELARALKAIRVPKRGGLRLAIDSTMARLGLRAEAQQLWYDDESKHGLDPGGQKKWQELVAKSIADGNAPLPDPPQKYLDQAKKMKAAAGE
jgi:uncharacterized protein DUF922